MVHWLMTSNFHVRTLMSVLCVKQDIESFVSNKWIKDHLISNRLFIYHQFAYSKHHSTETAFIHIHDHLIIAVELQKVLCL